MKSKRARPGSVRRYRLDVPVTINNISRIDSSLQLGSVTETVLVSSQAQLLQTDRAEIREEVTTKELADLRSLPAAIISRSSAHCLDSVHLRTRTRFPRILTRASVQRQRREPQFE